MVEAPICAGPLHSIERARLFNDKNFCVVAPGVEAKFAELTLGDIAALPAERQSVFHRPNGLRQAQGFFSFGLHEVKGQALRAFMADAGEPDKFLDQSRQ